MRSAAISPAQLQKKRLSQRRPKKSAEEVKADEKEIAAANVFDEAQAVAENLDSKAEDLQEKFHGLYKEAAKVGASDQAGEEYEAAEKEAADSADKAEAMEFEAEDKEDSEEVVEDETGTSLLEEADEKEIAAANAFDEAQAVAENLDSKAEDLQEKFH